MRKKKGNLCEESKQPPPPPKKKSIKIPLFTNSNWISHPFVLLRNCLVRKLISFPTLLSALRLISAEVLSFLVVLIICKLH